MIKRNFVDMDLSIKKRFQVLDQHAWDIICNWPERIGFDPCIDEIDYSLLFRSFLWDKVSRALRLTHDRIDSTFELKHLPEYNLKQVITPKGSEITEVIKFRESLDNIRGNIFVPIYSETHLGRLTRELLDTQGFKVITRNINIRKALNSIRPKKVPSIDEKYFFKFFEALIFSLKSYDLDLIAVDKAFLFDQIMMSARHFQYAKAELQLMSPKSILLYADNYFPSQNYVFAAKALGITSFTINHGLDCERYYLDDTYADHVFVWGQKRKERYLERNPKKSLNIYAFGNPNFDDRKITKKIKISGTNILLLCRPHQSEKCLSVSRSPSDVIPIIQCIIEFLQRNKNWSLTIKLHPCTNKILYRFIHELTDEPISISISQKSLGYEISKASVVITEDSTAGLEALLEAKCLIHSHFSPTEPILPFVKYNSALPGGSSSELLESLEFVKSHKNGELNFLNKGRIQFIKNFGGRLDGKSTERVVNKIIKIVG